MKLIIDLAADAVSSESAKTPMYVVVKPVGSKTKELRVAASAAKAFKTAVANAKKAHAEVAKLNAARAFLETQREKAKAKGLNVAAKDQLKGRIGTGKRNVATAKKNITTLNTAAINALKVFGTGISVPFTTAELISPTKNKSAKMKQFKGLVVKGLTGFVTEAKSVADDKIADIASKKTSKKPSNAEAKARTKKRVENTSPAVLKAKINGAKLTPAQIAKMNASHAEMKKKHAAEDRAHLKNINAAFGTKLKKSDLKGAKVASNKLGALKITLRDGTVHTLAGSLAKKAGINRDVIDLILPE